MSASEPESEKFPRFSVGGLAFGDLYRIESNHDPANEGAQGFVLRRGYLTFDGDFNKRWFGRLRFEVNQAGEFEVYDFEVDFKDLHAGWKVGRHKLLFGLTPTPTFDLAEKVWGLRYLARTPLDLQGIPSRDTGVYARGPLNKAGTVNYRAMLGTGAEFGNETGDGARWLFAVAWNPAPRWTLDFYGDYEKRPGPDWTTLQGFVARQSERLRWSAQYSYQDRENDPALNVASAMIVGDITKKISLIGRVDRLFEPSPSGDNIRYIPFDPTAPATFSLSGMEFRVAGNFTLTPNVIYTFYDENDKGVTPESDLHLRFTMFINFE